MKNLLKELNMTIQQFSEKYEIPYNTVRQWERGLNSPPKYVMNLLREKIEREKNGEQITIEDIKEKEKFNVLHTIYYHGYETYNIYKEGDPFYRADIEFRQNEDKKGYRFTPKWETFEVYKK